MKHKYLIVLIIGYLLTFTAYAQNATITGIVKDEGGLPIQGVSVMIKGTKNGTSTAANGSYTLSAPANSVLVFVYVGFKTKEVTFTGQTTISITLEESMTNLNDVVVIGYQQTTRKKSTGAIASISGKELANLPSASFDQLLQGRLAGVNVQNFSGAPGGASTVSVRGTSAVSLNYSDDAFNVLSSPLYVIDGVPQPNQTYVSPGAGTGSNYLAGLNPSDIESIDVLKDASATAIYGSSAANGVILITTKKGTNTEPRVTLSTWAGVTQRPQLRDVTLGSVERHQKLAILDAQLDYLQKRDIPYLLTDSLNPAFNGNTDWQDMFYQTGFINSTDVSLTGGGQGGMTYRFNGNYYDEEGIIKATGFTRYSTRLNLQARALKEKLLINPIIAFSRSDRARGNGSNSSPISLGAGNMPSSLLNLSEAKRALYLGEYDASADQNTDNNLNLNLNFDYEFSKKFRFISQNSYVNTTARRDLSRTSILENNTGNSSYSYTGTGTNLRTNNYLSYIDSYKKHSFNVVLGQEAMYREDKSSSLGGFQGVSDVIQVVTGFQQKNIYASSDYQSSGDASFYGRLSYDFDSKYVIGLTGRMDGSSRFGKDSKWGFFPSASAAWLISEENFFKDNFKKLSLVKLRGSIGLTGNSNLPNSLQYSLYNVNAGGYAGNGGATSYNGVTSITPNFTDGVAQNNLSWEHSLQWNFGTDIEMDGGRYSLSFDVYNKENTLGLFSVALPITTGYERALTNSIGVRNNGLELALSANPLAKTSPIKWMSRFNISYNKNTIMSLPNGGRDLVMSGGRFDKSHILSVGSPINAFYLYRTKGVFSRDSDVPVNPYTGERYGASGNAFRAGDFYFEDVDGDYNIDPFNDGINPDKIPMGDPNPKWTGGFTNNFTYKNWTLGVFATFTFDRDVLNLFESDRFSTSASGNAASFANFSTGDLDKLNIWRKPGDQAEYAKYEIGSYRYYYASSQSFFLEKGGYLRIKSVSLNYSLAQNVVRRLGLGSVKIFAVADNLAMFQQSKRLPDAEAVNAYGEYNGAGYPIPKKYTFGLDINF